MATLIEVNAGSKIDGSLPHFLNPPLEPDERQLAAIEGWIRYKTVWHSWKSSDFPAPVGAPVVVLATTWYQVLGSSQ